MPTRPPYRPCLPTGVFSLHYAYAAVLVVLCALPSAMRAQIPFPLPTQAETLSIRPASGSDNPVKPGQIVTLLVSGIENIQSAEARCWPSDGVEFKAILGSVPQSQLSDWIKWQTIPQFIFRSSRPGDFLIDVVENGHRASYVVEVAGSPSPDPDPDPDPDPPPIPESLWGITIEESSKRKELTVNQLDALLSKEVRDLFQPGRFRVLDKDITDENGLQPEGWAPFLDRASGKKLPYFMLVGDGRILWEGPFPANTRELISLIRPYVKLRPQQLNNPPPLPQREIRSIPRKEPAAKVRTIVGWKKVRTCNQWGRCYYETVPVYSDAP